MENILYFDYNDYSSILLIFFFNALVFSFLFLRKGIAEQVSSSNWLALFIFLGALYISPFMTGYGGWYSKKPYREFLFFMPLQQLLLIGPVFFFYTKSLLHNSFKVGLKDSIHFLPATLYLIYSLVVFVVDKLILDEFYFYADGKDKDLSEWYQMAGLLSMLLYLFLSFKYYQNYRKFTQQEVSYANEIAFRWLNYFMIAFAIILLLRVVFFIVNPEWWNFGSKFWYYLCFSILLFYIAISGYSNTLKISFRARGIFPNNFQPDQKQTANEVIKSNSDGIDLKQWKEKINAYFEDDQITNNPSLTLTEVAQELNTNRNVISTVINQEFQINFNDFVNQKRVDAVIEKFHNLEHKQTTLLGIALDCGFNSKATFNRAFKKQKGVTPKQYIDKYIT